MVPGAEEEEECNDVASSRSVERRGLCGEAGREALALPQKAQGRRYDYDCGSDDNTEKEK